MDREHLIRWGTSRIEKGLRMDTRILAGSYKRAIREHFGGHQSYLEALGIWDEYKLGKYRKSSKCLDTHTTIPHTKESVIALIKIKYEKGESIHYSALCKNHSHLMKRVLELFGSHKQLIIEAGLDYEKIKGGGGFSKQLQTKSLVASQLGMLFEELVAKLFLSLGIPFTQYESGIPACVPDFIFSDNHWVDAKLSVNTNTSEMRNKYLQHCKKLTIYHLIGSHDYYAILPDGTERCSIFYYLYQCSTSIQNKYLPLFLQLEEVYTRLLA